MRLAFLSVGVVLAGCSQVSGSSGDAGAQRDAGGRIFGPSLGAGSDGATGCAPEATEACDCGDPALVGARRCAPDGAGWSSCACDHYGDEIAVSPSGDDRAAGTLAAPFRTLARARAEVTRRVAAGLLQGGLVVWLRGGLYPLDATLSLGAPESGSDGKPVVWRGYPGESARLIGGVQVDPSAFLPISQSSPIYARLDPPAQAQVVELALSSVGITDLGALSRRGFCGAAASSPLELFVDGQAMTLARWPDASQDDLASGPETIHHGFATIAAAASAEVWRYAGDRPARWKDPANVWFHGFWKFPWADCHLKAASIDPATQTVMLVDSPSYDPTAGQPYYAYNIPEEITEPGEYWIDSATGRLYLWPPPGFSSAEILASTLDGPLVTLSNASSVELRDLTLEAGRSRLVTVEGGAHDRLVGLTLANAGTDAALISGSDQLVDSCDIYGSGNGGVLVSGGDRATLTAGDNAVENSHLHDLSRWEWTYRPAVRLDGDGNRATHNLIEELPHSAILYSGNDHDIELNEIRRVCRFSSDAGAIYAGRDWGARGNVIKHNFIHDLTTVFDGYGVHGIYLDDCLSGVRVEGNLLYRISGDGIVHGGGRDDLMVNNLIARSGAAIAADRRCATGLSNGTPNDLPGDSWNLLAKLERVGYQSPAWTARFPECAAIPDDWTALSSPPSHWLEPEGSVLARNLGFANSEWARGTAETFAAYAQVQDNLQDVDPQFVDEANLNLALKPSSPAFGIPGFEPIPFAEIGIKP